MTLSPIIIKEETTLEEASKIMEKSTHIHRLPVVKDGVLAATVTRRDLVRGWLGMSVP